MLAPPKLANEQAEHYSCDRNRYCQPEMPAHKNKGQKEEKGQKKEPAARALVHAGELTLTTPMPRHSWNLQQARRAASQVLEDEAPTRAVKALLARLTSEDPTERMQAADTVQRISESQDGLSLLVPHSNALLDSTAAALAELDDWRTRGHLILVAARTAKTAAQYKRCAEMIMPSMQDSHGVVRANAIEALGLLGQKDSQLLKNIEPLIAEALRTGSAAERVRAREALNQREKRRIAI